MGRFVKFQALIWPLVIGAILSLLVFDQVKSWENAHFQQTFEYRADTRTSAIKNVLDHVFETADHVVAVVRHELVVEQVDELASAEIGALAGVSDPKNPEVRLLAWLPRLESADSNNHRAPKYRDFDYQLLMADQKRENWFKPELLPIPSRWQHMLMAMDTGHHRVDIYPEGDDHHVLIIFSPVYKNSEVDNPAGRRDALLGFVVSEWNVAPLIDESLRNMPTAAVDYYLRDASDPQKMPFYFHLSRTRSGKDQALKTGISTEKIIVAGEHKWHVRFEAAPAFLKQHQSFTALQSVGLVLLLSCMLAGYLWISSRKTTEIAEMVEQRTAELHSEKIKLGESMSRYDNLVKSIPVGVYLFRFHADDSMGFEYISPVFCKILGLDADAVLHDASIAFSAAHHDDLDNLIRANNEAKVSNKPFRWEGRFIVCGKTRWIQIESDLTTMDESGSLWSGVVSDITERKEAEKRLKMLFQAMEHAGEAAVITDRDAIIEYANPAFAAITGYSVKEVIGKTPAILKSSAQDPAFYKDLWDTILRGEVWQGTLIDRRKDGSFYPALLTVAPIHDDSGNITHFVSLQQDMSEYKRLEEQFLQSQKMEAIGVLVGGIAHDFNNMLAGIVGNAYMAKSRIKGDQKLLANIESIDRISMRAAGMIKQLLTFARKEQVEMSDFPLTPFLKEAAKLASTAVPENIERSCETPSEELYIHGDPTQLQQVIMNLINNAKDALEGIKGGKISCTLKPYISDASFRQRHPDCKGKRFACLMVSDNGEGIPEVLVSKIFDPFFTTKGVGKGTGLGLAMVYGAIEGHKGAIEVDSVPGGGTTFTIYLPLVESATEAERVRPQQVAAGQNELILVADDEALVLEMYESVLNELGYRVVAARNGEEAVRLFEHNMNELALVILDVVMPVLGGIDAAKRIKQLGGHLPIVFATGYDRGSFLDEKQDLSGQEIINKPFTVESLSQLIRQILDAKEAG
ncbi:PAS domain S-box-containing protein [Mariprofundus aestuarium]|uniref:histidine kinase n=1 Tax=Mariprofundus aestuarium TaxID=1921086 RepID=A0A2K8L6W2_MARES|nr:PAS domain S-box protein [Mariprofundus aestuarium]ATX79996.1 PAS domain S-box-containing protein [Mariprofundus aestuarium]